MRVTRVVLVSLSILLGLMNPTTAGYVFVASMAMMAFLDFTKWIHREVVVERRQIRELRESTPPAAMLQPITDPDEARLVIERWFSGMVGHPVSVTPPIPTPPAAPEVPAVQELTCGHCAKPMSVVTMARVLRNFGAMCAHCNRWICPGCAQANRADNEKAEAASNTTDN